MKNNINKLTNQLKYNLKVTCICNKLHRLKHNVAAMFIGLDP